MKPEYEQTANVQMNPSNGISSFNSISELEKPLTSLGKNFSNSLNNLKYDPNPKYIKLIIFIHL